MIFKEIIEKSEWNIVKKELFDQYEEDGDILKNIEGYKKVYDELFRLKPITEDNMVICIEPQWEEEDKKYWFIVHGYDKNDKQYYAIEYSEWERWLGWEVSEKAIQQFSINQIVAHCLWEMTWGGFDQETIRKKMEEINASIKEAMQEINSFMEE